MRFLRLSHVPGITACIEKGPLKNEFSFFHRPFFIQRHKRLLRKSLEASHLSALPNRKEPPKKPLSVSYVKTGFQHTCFAPMSVS